MYVPWIHGNEPVPEWWQKLLRLAEDVCERVPAEHPFLVMLEDRRTALEAEVDRMPPLSLSPEWPGYLLDVPLDMGAVPADVVQVDANGMGDTSDVGVKD